METKGNELEKRNGDAFSPSQRNNVCDIFFLNQLQMVTSGRWCVKN